MAPPTTAAVVLALVAGRVAGLVHPATGAVHVAAAATSTYHRRNPARLMPLRRSISAQCISRGFSGCQRTLAFQHWWPTSSTSAALRGTHPTNAVQSASQRRRRLSILMAGGQSQGRGGGPIGGYPPPENLHGVFAVYKPKGYTSNDVVQKIKVNERERER